MSYVGTSLFFLSEGSSMSVFFCLCCVLMIYFLGLRKNVLNGRKLGVLSHVFSFLYFFSLVSLRDIRFAVINCMFFLI